MRKRTLRAGKCVHRARDSATFFTMAIFRRVRACGATYFFTVVTHDRQALLTHPHTIAALRDAFRSVRHEQPFEIVACAVMPDHLHAIWVLPPDDADYSLRWSRIKRHVSRTIRDLVTAPIRPSMRSRGESGVWQRRFWEHQIRDEADLRRHVDYIHYNPVKHGLVEQVCDWPYSSFHRYVRAGDLPRDWAAAPDAIPDSIGGSDD